MRPGSAKRGSRSDAERADARWKRLKSRGVAVGLVGFLRDITPGSEKQQTTFSYERIREDEIGSEGDDGTAETKSVIVFADRRPNPLDDEETFTVVVPKPGLGRPQ